MEEIRKELLELKYIQGVCKIVYCSSDEEKEIVRIKQENGLLPEDVIADGYGSYFRYVGEDLSEQEIKELILFRQLENQEKLKLFFKSIRNILIYLAIISSMFVATLFYMLIKNSG